jgi:hypothetical protein
MIIDIGLMMGAYIVTRMLQAMIKRESDAYAVVQVFAVITILVTIFCCFDLVMHSGQISGLIK